LPRIPEKNKLYFAFRELGYVVRTMFLLEYLSDLELRRLLQSATNKSERFNHFVQWVAFGGGSLVSEGVRDEQRKFIKYNHLVANLLIYYDVVTMPKALERLAADSHTFDEDLVFCISPYLPGRKTAPAGSCRCNPGEPPIVVALPGVLVIIYCIGAGDQPRRGRPINAKSTACAVLCNIGLGLSRLGCPEDG
jgi:hypothetical protein